MAVITDIHWDAEQEELLMWRVDESGEMIEDGPQVLLKLEDTKGSDGLYHPIKFREMCVITSAPGVTPITYGTVMVLCSEAYTVS